MLTIRDIIQEMEVWAPPGIAWERDNVGLQIGDVNDEVSGVLAALEITPEVIKEALQKKCNLILTHHPLIFKPLQNLTPKTFSGKLALDIARNGLNLYAAHTNLDFTKDGVNFALAQKLNLQNIEFLYQEGSTLKKIAVFVPPDYAEQITNAMTKAGAGIIGNYDACSFQTRGTGTFRPAPGAQPFSGEIGSLQHEDEIRIEMITPKWKSQSVVNAMIDAHPYEEVAYDVYSNEAIDPMYGAGIIGTLSEAMPVEDFIKMVKNALQVPAVRWTRSVSDSVSRVAVCGGSGSDLMPAALQKKADAFVTADIKYHAFHEARGIINLIDAGHYETEVWILDVIIKRLKKKFSNTSTKFHTTKINTNPIHYS